MLAQTLLDTLVAATLIYWEEKSHRVTDSQRRSEVAVAASDSYSDAKHTVRLAQTGLTSKVAAASWYCVVAEQDTTGEHTRFEVAVGGWVW